MHCKIVLERYLWILLLWNIWMPNQKHLVIIFKVFGFYSRGTENGSRWILNRFLVCQAILLRNRSFKPWNTFYAPPPILNEYMGCSKQCMICSHHCFWSLVWPLECSGWLAGCISRPQTAFYGLDMQPASQPSHSKGHTWLQKKWCSQIMNCFLQPMYSFRIGGGALKDY